MKYELKPFWNRYFKFDWKFGLFLLVIVCVTRFVLVLKANETGNYSLIGLIMFLSAIIPFVFLSKYGRNQIGIKTTKKLKYLILALGIGIGFSVILHFLGQGLYGKSYENWYVYIGKSYNIPENISVQGKRTMFLIMAIMGMIFSPIGEELFFRGIVHGSFAKSVGVKKASFIDSSAFALTHISHFGLVFVNKNWDFYLVPGIIWVLGMFIASLLFFEMKKRTDSLLGAILCHSGFNLGMIYCIFYLI
ncbi:CPBP family intramembrane glutamic endopeptidase [Chryseobacterium sp. MP_3.2]|uniref:CPBP family intramembrane glutamic endopeptidase n=1 Tax=Chryseobacterium sp. MP_3.2 TaxID=3071712 RepID=UPI002E03C65F|nr:membrane protease YdiL (CAAX protease family) [Chryseobacterium sp. MP_3.2]